ncbi:DUF1254 domain-containing protein [Demequina lignilytica]|uniref:DUF1254 domain-containing protein n=1 Tax=Demequina lignilytica TaxID=3051663 RepID=A0AB35MEZ1_9MICO|nr:MULTISPECIES: DUF1254 domain-containing protein [unclassified Demequina]MDN4482312.1 DUF1254 domain-containing protein [Demequina sp. SYSU T0a273]MDN4489647.1 DUF1254 domain-containing protein [Demequina sp. SYSU T00068]
MSAMDRDLARIAVEGFQYFYPLVLMDVTRRVATSLPAGVRHGFAPPDTFAHARAFPPGDFREVVRPNFDTLYSTAWLDLRDGPQVVSIAAPIERYFMLPLLDLWSDVFAVIGSRTTGGAPADYAIVPPGWPGEVPDGMVRIDAPTAWVWVLGRTRTDGIADYPRVHAIQDGLAIRPLRGATAGGVAPGDDPGVRTSPMDHVAAMTGEEFFRIAADLLADNPPHLTDQPMVARLRALGIVPGRPFDAGAASPEAREAISAAPRAGLAAMAAAVTGLAQASNGWSIRRSGIGVYGTDYLFRAMIAMIGLGANLAEDAVYPMLLVDEAGTPPVGEVDHVLHFDSSELPPADAFWSVTMYDGTGFPVPNALERYALGDRDPLTYGADGSLDIWIGRESPGPERDSNWLPAPAGPLGLTLRLYGPRPEVLDGRWSPPPLRRA